MKNVETDLGVTNGWSLLTDLGEVVAPDEARLVTKTGLMESGAIAAALRAGRTVRLEMIDPKSVFREPGRNGGSPVAMEESASRLGDANVRIPKWLARDTDVLQRVRGHLDRAAIQYSEGQSEHWQWLTPISSEPRRETASWESPGEQAELMLLMAAWDVTDGRPIGRFPEPDWERLQILTGLLAYAHESYRVRWLPAYRPVEARVEPSGSVFRSHVSIVRVLHRSLETSRVVVDRPGLVISGLALQS